MRGRPAPTKGLIVTLLVPTRRKPSRNKNAADAFLKGYKKYKSGDKAPETLLKLGMSLAALGPRRPARLSASSRPNFQRHLRPSATKPRPSRRRPAADT